MSLKPSGIAIHLAALLISLFCLNAYGDANRSGSWFDPARDGEGFVVQFIDDDSAIVYWFTYDEAGNQRWFVGSGVTNGNRLEIDALLITEGGVFGPGFNPDAVQRVDVGELVLTFTNDTNGRADYTINGVKGQQQLSRITRPVEVSSDAETNIPRKSGSWFDPTRDGEGVVMEVLPDGLVLAYWFTYDIDGNQAWMLALGSGDLRQGSFRLDLLKPTGGRFGPDFDPDDVVRSPAGEARIGLQCEGGFGDFVSADAEDFVDIRFDLQQIVGIASNRCNDPALVNRFPLVNGEVAPPDHEAGRQLRWVLEQLAGTDAFTEAVIRERFSSGAIAQRGIPGIRNLLEDARVDYPSARLTDPLALASTRISGLLTASNGREAFITLDASQDDGRINTLNFQDFGTGQGSVVVPPDSNLNLQQAVDRFQSLSSQSSIVVARINGANQCETVIGRNASVPRATASVFKIYILGGVADALDAGAFFHDNIVSLDGSKQVQGGPLFSEPAGIPFSIDKLSTLMMAVSDNTATDMLLDIAGRDRFDGLHAAYGHETPALMTPQLGISENFHLFFSFPFNESLSYVNGSESFRRQFLADRIVPLGSSATGGGGFNHESLYIDASWQASALDICRAYARHRLHTPGSDAALVVDRALQSQSAQPNVREHWDRVWYKGGGLSSGVNGRLVVTHAWMLERAGEAPWVVVGLANEPAGGIDPFVIQSNLGRVLELVRDR
ncbi:MAG: serine hydrolase [Pseudomonadota bacterium]